MQLPYKTYRSFLKTTFGEPVLKVPVNGGFTCPNKKNSKGCTFCDNRSFSPAALKSDEVVEQFVKVRNRSKRFNKFIPYLQPNTNTYGTVEELKSIYEPLLAQDGVVGFAIGTRPDALSDEILDYLEEINERTYLSLEIGLQSSSDDTLRRIRRGHDYARFVDAVERVAARGIEIVVHLMAGLPGETREDAVESAKAISALPVQGVKIHQLMVIEDTELADEFAAGEFQVLSLEEYIDTLSEMMEYLRSDILIHRLMADAKPEFGLIEPMWCADKDASIAIIQKALIDCGVVQGRLWK